MMYRKDLPYHSETLLASSAYVPSLSQDDFLLYNSLGLCQAPVLPVQGKMRNRRLLTVIMRFSFWLNSMNHKFDS